MKPRELTDGERELRDEAQRDAAPDCDRLLIYDQLRRMHSLLKDIAPQVNEWDQNALDAVHGVLYLAEGVFAGEGSPGFDFAQREPGSGKCG